MSKLLAESLHQYLRFTEEGDPIEDMGIGVKNLIHNWLYENNIISQYLYDINPRNMKIDVYTTVKLDNLRIKRFPEYIKFNEIRGGFHCDHNELETLRGCPKIVSGAFICSYNNLKNLVYGPKITSIYIASHNKLTSLEGLTQNEMQLLSISNNNLTNLKGIPKRILGDLNIHNNPIKTLEFFPDIIDGDLYYTSSKILNINSITERCNVKGSLINKT